MESAAATSSQKSKILPVVLLSTIPLNLWNGKNDRGNSKANIKNYRTQPYSLLTSERTSCSNCNKHTGNQKTSTNCETTSSASSVFSSAIKVSSMFQSPMLILPIVPAKSSSAAASTASSVSKALPNIIYNNQQQQYQQQQPLSVYHHAKRVADETNNRVRICAKNTIKIYKERKEIFYEQKIFFFLHAFIIC